MVAEVNDVPCSERSKLMSELVTALWWTSTASVLGPDWRAVAGRVMVVKADSAAPPMAMGARVRCVMSPAGMFWRAISWPLR